MTMSVHNPDQYMSDLRQIIGQGRKRIGILVGAGAPAGMFAPGSSIPLIPAVAGLTTMVVESLKAKFGPCLSAIRAEIPNATIEDILSRVRSLSGVIGKTAVHGLDANGHKDLGAAICEEIGKIVRAPLYPGSSPYTELVSWISGTAREHAVEIFTTNYDLLFEQAMERARVPYFDGFAGGSEPFFDSSTVASNDLPPRWIRLWKLHGSLGWAIDARGEVIRNGSASATQLVYPEQQKYSLTQKAPYAALFDRLRSFLMTPDTLLIVSGFSFADAHISSRIDECLAANAATTVLAFQFKSLAEEKHASEIALRRANMSLYSPDKAIINGVAAPWMPGESPTKHWEAIRATYWGDGTPQFLLGRFDKLCRFFASARTSQRVPAVSPGASAAVA